MQLQLQQQQQQQQLPPQQQQQLRRRSYPEIAEDSSATGAANGDLPSLTQDLEDITERVGDLASKGAGGDLPKIATAANGPLIGAVASGVDLMLAPPVHSLFHEQAKSIVAIQVQWMIKNFNSFSLESAVSFCNISLRLNCK